MITITTVVIIHRQHNGIVINGTHKDKYQKARATPFYSLLFSMCESLHVAVQMYINYSFL